MKNRVYTKPWVGQFLAVKTFQTDPVTLGRFLVLILVKDNSYHLLL